MVRLIGSAALAVALSFAGELIWSGLFRVNLRIGPEVAWSAVLMCGLIAVSWRGMSSAMPLRPMLPISSKWQWSGVAVLSMAACLTGMVILGFRIGHFTRDEFGSSIDTRTISTSLLAARVLMAPFVAAFFEETGFRGLLQPMLERRWGQRTAIATTAVLFYALHLVHGWARGDALTDLVVAIPMITGGILFGALALSTNSVAPCILAHALTDISLLPLEWSGRYNITPVTVTGIDLHFGVWTAVSVLSLAATLYALNRLSPNGARWGFTNAHD